MQETTMLTWIIPVYNGEKYLGQAIESILRQPCGDFSIIVVDDGSKDRSLEIARSYTDSRIRVLHKENGGVSSARNMGIDHATSKYVAFLDADDVVCRDAYNEQVYMLLQKDCYDVVSLAYYTGDQKLKYGSYRPVNKVGEQIGDGTSADPYKSFCSSIYRVELLNGEDKIRFPEGIRYAEDVVFHFLTNCKSGRYINLVNPWFVYRNNNQSVLHQMRDCEYIHQYCIPAWDWCKSMCDTDQAKTQCNQIIVATAAEYIRHACEAGTSVHRILSAINKPEILEALRDRNSLWPSSLSIYESFSGNPQRYWWRQRIRGIVTNVGKCIVRLPVMRSLYFRIKYKEDISAIV